MAARVVLDNDACVAVRVSYETTDEPVDDIGQRFGSAGIASTNRRAVKTG